MLKQGVPIIQNLKGFFDEYLNCEILQFSATLNLLFPTTIYLVPLLFMYMVDFWVCCSYINTDETDYWRLYAAEEGEWGTWLNKLNLMNLKTLSHGNGINHTVYALACNYGIWEKINVQVNKFYNLLFKVAQVEFSL